MQHMQHGYKHSSNSLKSTIIMIILMILAGLFATMNIFADKLSDLRWSLNDFYMAIFMVGWMMLFMGAYYRVMMHVWIGIGMIIVGGICIRMQLFITPGQYFTGMIPHHSMAVFMSRKLLENYGGEMNKDKIELVANIIKTQNNEIEIFKQ